MFFAAFSLRVQLFKDSYSQNRQSTMSLLNLILFITRQTKWVKDVHGWMVAVFFCQKVRTVHHFQKVESHFYKLFITTYTKKRQVNAIFIPENSVWR